MPDDDQPSPPNELVMRAMGEGDRSTTYKRTRDAVVLGIRQFLDDVESRQSSDRPLGRFGPVHNRKGIDRQIIEDPLAEPTKEIGPLTFQVPVNLMATRYQPDGAYFNRDEETGERTLVIIDRGRIVEITDNPIEQLGAGPEEGYETVRGAVLASFQDQAPDGSYVGAQVAASGRLTIKTFDVGGSHSSAEPSRVDAQCRMVADLWKGLHADLVKDGPGRTQTP